MLDEFASDEDQPEGERAAGDPEGDGGPDPGVRTVKRFAEMARHGKSLAVTLAGIVTVGVGVWSQIESCGSERKGSASPEAGSLARGWQGAELDDPVAPHDPLAAQALLQKALEMAPENRRLLGLREAVESIHRTGGYFVRMDMRSFGLAHAELPQGHFAGANGAGAIFREARLESSDFADAKLDGAVFRGARLGGADFTRADLHGADFREAVLHDPDAGATHLPDALSCVDFTGVDFAGVDLTGRSFITSSVAHAEFSGADLSAASFPYTDVTGADFSNATGLTQSYQLAQSCAGDEPPVLPPGLEWSGVHCRRFESTRRDDCTTG